MCTVNDEDVISELMTEKETITLTGTKCRKCNESESEIVLRGKDLYCRACFLAYMTHKFRASLGKSKMVRKGDKILIGFSGGASSVAMLHLINAGLEEAAHKRLVFEPLVVYIDEGGIGELTLEERQKILKDIIELLTHFKLPCCISTLESLFQSIEDQIVYDLDCEIPLSSESQLSKLLGNVRSQTSKIDLLAKLRNELLFKIATNTGCCKILTAETSVDTATKLLSNIALGRGGQLPFDVGFCDSRAKSIKVLRPMQDFGTDEIEFYNEAFKIKPVEKLLSNRSKNNSLQMLTKRFVNDLQKNFPSTISTVYRTGAKFNVDMEAEVAMESCPLCRGPIDTSVIESSSLQATAYSNSVSNGGIMNSLSNGIETNHELEATRETHCSKTSGDCNCRSIKSMTVSLNDASNVLCYGCRMIANDLESIDMLPEVVKNAIVQNSALKQMKNEIQDFLL